MTPPRRGHGWCPVCHALRGVVARAVEAHEANGSACAGEGLLPLPARPPRPQLDLEQFGLCRECAVLVTPSDYAIHEAATPRWWHADCWWAHVGPGQGDLLDVLAVTGRR